MSLTIPAFTLPAPLARIGRRLPQWPHAAALCLALNAAARLGILPADELEALEGKHFAVEVTDSGGIARFGVRNGWFVPDFAEVTPDLSFRAKLAAYLQLLNRQEDPDTLFFQRALVVEGDTELGLRVKNMLDAVDWNGLMERLPVPFRRLVDSSTAIFRR
ncbi:MAG TPA: SCP2 sterol-binding domain-containing protein [Rhodocyclaceae bacterium]|nr:SCP2 sterol-binding domain-containing protein [Rhodocyclaceae bacterium]